MMRHHAYLRGWGGENLTLTRLEKKDVSIFETLKIKISEAKLQVGKERPERKVGNFLYPRESSEVQGRKCD